MPPSFLPEDSLAKLHVGEVLGKGAFAVVYAADYEGRKVALKVLHPEYSNKDNTQLKLFFREAECLSSPICDHR